MKSELLAAVRAAYINGEISYSRYLKLTNEIFDSIPGMIDAREKHNKGAA